MCSSDLEPIVIPKRTLAGPAGERVDTRVLQVVYEAQQDERSLFAGQILDVSIVAPTAVAGSAR